MTLWGNSLIANTQFEHIESGTIYETVLLFVFVYTSRSSACQIVWCAATACALNTFKIIKKS